MESLSKLSHHTGGHPTSNFSGHWSPNLYSNPFSDGKLSPLSDAKLTTSTFILIQSLALTPGQRKEENEQSPFGS
jgi:hypothetical protein